jgi:rRNA processing protein Krr1/Pno1
MGRENFVEYIRRTSFTMMHKQVTIRRMRGTRVTQLKSREMVQRFASGISMEPAVNIRRQPT